jgi:hypothetical protein
MVNLYDHVNPLSSPCNIQTKERDIYFPLPYLIFKTSKEGEYPFLLLPSPLLPPLTLYSPPPPPPKKKKNFQTHNKTLLKFLSHLGDKAFMCYTCCSCFLFS